MKPSAFGWESALRGGLNSGSIVRMGARNDGMCNIFELLINVVTVNRPKMLTGLNQNGKGYGEVFVCHFTRSMIPPANRQTLTHRVGTVEHGKPNYLHFSMESDPQGKPIDKWVEEAGESERHPVIGWIRVQDLLGMKVSRLPAGVESREMYATF